MGQSFHCDMNNLSVMEAIAYCLWDPEGLSPWSQEPQLIVLIVLRFVLVLSSHLCLGCPSGFFPFMSFKLSFIISVISTGKHATKFCSYWLLSAVCLLLCAQHRTDGRYEPQFIHLPVCVVAMVMCCAKTAVQCVDGCDSDSFFVFYFIWITRTAYHSSPVLATVHCDVNKEWSHIPLAEWLLLLTVSYCFTLPSRDGYFRVYPDERFWL